MSYINRDLIQGTRSQMRLMLLQRLADHDPHIARRRLGLSPVGVVVVTSTAIWLLIGLGIRLAIG